MESTNLKKTLAFPKLKKLGFRPHAGVCAPLFCVRTKKSLGIGEYLDLLPLIDLCKKADLSILQLLPLNDSGSDSSPYSATSCLALNPVYISLKALPGAHAHTKLGKKLAKIEKKLKELDKKDKVAYPKVRALKLEYLALYYEHKQNSPPIKKGIQAFVKKNRWSSDFGLFTALNEVYEKPWWQFPKIHQKPSSSQKTQLKKRFCKEIQFVQFVQWVCFDQMKKVRLYAEKKKVFLKGDIPILVGKNSVDVWLAQDIFHITKSAGSPPDRFNKAGQNWGFPPFNWSEKEVSCLLFWKKRLKVAERLYHLYRLDHVVGFYRIWACKPGGKASSGAYLPKKREEQKSQGNRILKKILSFSSLYPIAEDLGAVPKWVREDLQELGISITKVMKDQHHWHKKNFFFSPKDYPILSMTTLATHDMEVMGMWWKHFPKLAAHYAKVKGLKYTKTITPDQQRLLLHDSYRTHSLFHISLLDEFLALFPKFTPINIERRQVNTPGTWSPSNWSYRFEPTVEALASSKAFMRSLKAITRPQ